MKKNSLNFVHMKRSCQKQPEFCLLYPEWFIAAYPDVVNWILDNHEKSRVFNTLTEELIMELERDTEKKNNFIRKLINEYRMNVSDLLVCTERFKEYHKNELLKYPKKVFDSSGKLIKETILRNEYELTNSYYYNTNNLITRIDQVCNDVYGEWELNPSEIFEYDESGLICKYLMYDIDSNDKLCVVKTALFTYEYDFENNLISAIGPYTKTGYYFYHDICLKFNYTGNTVDILFDRNFLDFEIKSIENKINQLKQLYDQEDSKELKKNLNNEIGSFRKEISAIINQKLKIMEREQYIKKEQDENYTYLAKIDSNQLIPVLNSYTDINIFNHCCPVKIINRVSHIAD